MTRILIFILSLIVAAGLVCRGVAWWAHERGSERSDLALLRLAARLDPFVSDYAYDVYDFSDELRPLQRAIRLEPSRPQYHMDYGLQLLAFTARTPASDRAAVREVCLAAELKPYSKEYRLACDEFKQIISAAQAE